MNLYAMDKKYFHGKKYLLIRDLKHGILFKSPLLSATENGNKKVVDIMNKT